VRVVRNSATLITQTLGRGQRAKVGLVVYVSSS